MMKRLGEDTNLMRGVDYEKQRPAQNDVYKILVDNITKG
jgi:hypothetical protein|tara:strand:+ start:358 stop:474 length:117 start_codon:yes stop_codon:yes gene_type:complete